MRDGYYLSTYLHIDSEDRRLNVRIRHDQSLALWQKNGDNVELIHYLELERYSGYKMHDIALLNIDMAWELIDEFLGEHNLTRDDIIEIWGTPLIDTVDDYHSIDDYQKINYHSICHLFSSILSDSNIFYNDEIIALAVDGGPDAVVDEDSIKKFFYAGCYVCKGKIKIWHINSPAQLWYYARQHYGLREGTLMALGSASTSELIDYKLEVERLDDFASFTPAYYEIKKLISYVDLLSENDEGISFNKWDNRFTIHENKISMVVKEIHKASIRIMEQNIEKLLVKYRVSPENVHLSISGGFALNCPTNSYLMHKYKFKSFVSCPCVSNSGIALGVGLYAFYKKMCGDVFNFQLKTAFHGSEYNGIDIPNEYIKFIECIEFVDAKIVANDIISSPIVWVNGASEIGPRALGNRSIIADPRNEKTKDLLNNIKQREWWRPVAPIILKEHLNDWFENAYHSPYMLHTFDIKNSKRELVPAILHLDGSARVQSISEEDNYSLYHVIKAFYEKTNIPIICNTSLNDRGEPIINNLEEALNFALRKNINVLYFNSYRLMLKNHVDFNAKCPVERKWHKYFYTNAEEISIYQEQFANQGITLDMLKFYRKNPKLKKIFDLSKKDDVRKFKIYIKLIMSKLNNMSNDLSIYEEQ